MVHADGGAGEDVRDRGGGSERRSRVRTRWGRSTCLRRRHFGAAGGECGLHGGQRAAPPAVDVASDGMRCVLRTALPAAGLQQNKRPVYVRVTRMDPALGGGSQFKIRVRERDGVRALADGGGLRLPRRGGERDGGCDVRGGGALSGVGAHVYGGPGWSGSIASFQLNVPAFGAVKQVIAKGSAVGADTEGTLRLNACGSPTQSAAGRAAREHVCVRRGGRSVHLFLHRDGERGQDAEHLVMKRTGLSGKGRIMSAGQRVTWAMGLVAGLRLGGLPAQAQTVGPLANTSVANARVIVPDGSSLLQTIGGGETRWFVFGVEPGKTYVVEVVDPASDLVANTIGVGERRRRERGRRRRRKPRWIARRMRGRRRWRWRTTGSAAWCGRFRRRRATPRTSGGSILPWRR